MIRVSIKIFIIVVLSSLSTCTISGISYMDPLPQRPLPDRLLDHCNQLYWYPRPIPDYCYIKTTPSIPNINTPKIPPPDAIPLPVPVPLPLPPPIPIPMPLPLPIPQVPHLPPFPSPISTNPLPMPGFAYSSLPMYPNNPYVSQQIGMVPGLPGLVSKNGGVNVLPFSDAYSDILEKQKNKMMRRRLHKLFRDYDEFPRYRLKRRYRKNLYLD